MSEPKSQTPINGWTIPTLKEHFETRFEQLDKLRKAEADTLKLQAAEYERRLTALNGEAQRIAKVHELNVTRDDLDRVERENTEWHRKQDLSLAQALPRPEFQAYKEATDRALQLKAGQSAGIGLTASTMVTGVALLFGLIGAVSAIVAMVLNK